MDFFIKASKNKKNGIYLLFGLGYLKVLINSGVGNVIRVDFRLEMFEGI